MEKQGWPKPADWMQRHEYPGPVVELTAEEKRAFGEIGIDMDEFEEGDIESDPFEQARVEFRRLVTKGSFGITEVAKNLNYALGLLQPVLSNIARTLLDFASQLAVRFEFNLGLNGDLRDLVVIPPVANKALMLLAFDPVSQYQALGHQERIMSKRRLVTGIRFRPDPMRPTRLLNGPLGESWAKPQACLAAGRISLDTI